MQKTANLSFLVLTLKLLYFPSNHLTLKSYMQYTLLLLNDGSQVRVIVQARSINAVTQ